MTVIEAIKANYNDMSAHRRAIADYILNNPSDVVQESISALARQSGAKSESSIVRFYRLLGFDSFSDFKISLAQELVGNAFVHSSEDLNLDDSIPEIRRKFISSSISSLTNLLKKPEDDVYEAAVNLILDAKRIILIGYAASAAICNYAYFRFMELGLNCHYTSDSHVSAAILAQPSPNDLIICISNSGETSDILRQLSPNNIHRSSIITITATAESTLAKIADVVICTETQETSLVTDSMNARLLQLCAVDLLYSILCIKLGDKAFYRLSKTRALFRGYKTASLDSEATK
ncbi:MAG: MurR/RpiR family transcriptional regulator [Oscillospiraceae bacterium]|nr:MurR/RpiR family transcriptional regulator [Oscillospiraceae bacterium]